MPRTSYPKSTKLPLLNRAVVAKISGNRVQLKIDDNLAWATIAVSPGYRPMAGDVVLAICAEDDWYVIGVIEGSGHNVFSAPGDMEFHAPNGSITFLSSERIKLQSDKVELKSNSLEFKAQELFERFGNVTRWIKDTLQMRIGRVRSRIDGDYHLSSGRILHDAKGDVSIKGESINLN